MKSVMDNVWNRVKNSNNIMVNMVGNIQYITNKIMWNNIICNVLSKVWDNVWRNVWTNVTSNVYVNVRDNVKSNVWDTMSDKTYTDEQLDDAFSNVELL